jgi:hypothetical protein
MADKTKAKTAAKAKPVTQGGEISPDRLARIRVWAARSIDHVAMGELLTHIDHLERKLAKHSVEVK